jgi:hypothetical protein
VRHENGSGLDLPNSERKRGVEGEILATVANPSSHAGWANDCQWLRPITLGHRHEETRNAQNVITMEMRNQNGLKRGNAESGSEDLRLRALSTVEKEEFTLPFESQAGMLSSFRWYCPTGSEKDKSHEEPIAAFGEF